MTTRGRLAFLLAATAVGGGLIIGGTVFSLVRSAARARYVERLRSEADLLAGWVSAQPQAGDPQGWAHDWGRRLDLRVTLIGRDGRVLGDSSVPAERLPKLENHLHRPEVQDATRTGWGSTYRASETTGETFFYLAHRTDGTGPVAFVRVALPAWQVRRAESPAWWLIALLLAVAPLTLAGTTYWAVRLWSRPLENLALVTDRIAAGDVELRAPFERDDEVGDVGRAVERVRLALAAKIAELEDERRRLHAVISAMREGLLFVDAGRRVRLANEAFLRAWGLRADPAGRLLPEVARSPQVVAAVEAALREGQETAERIVDAGGAGRAFEMEVAPLRNPEDGRISGAAALFFDVTRLEALESMRREFIANVTHELRTPLTAIRAAALTLLEAGEDRGAQAKFLDTIRRHAERMSALVDDLTDLSLIETGAIHLDLTPVDLEALVREVVAQVGPRYAALGLHVDVAVASPLLVQADRRRLEQILVNLVDNAMKFNRAGGSVRITAEQVGGRAVLVVEDTGAGIPSDHLEKIFHRFHRVDPASARDFGGTGLGLAIVKHLVQLHGGAVRVESELGRGSRFVVEF